jgi:hypothetical protein
MDDDKVQANANLLIVQGGTMAEPKKVGLLVGREWSFPPAFLEEVNKRDVGVVAEYVKLGGTKMNEPCEYAVLIDRISHEIPYYRAYLKNAMLQGAYCINNPFWWSADDKFFGASVITKMGLASPRTMVLPMRSYPEGVISESLRNLVYPLDWQSIIDYVGLPAILKDAWGGGWKNVYKVNSLDELWTAPSAWCCRSSSNLIILCAASVLGKRTSCPFTMIPSNAATSSRTII